MQQRKFPYGVGFVDKRPALYKKYNIPQKIQKEGIPFLIRKNTLQARVFTFLDDQKPPQIIQSLFDSKQIIETGKEDKKFKDGDLTSKELIGKTKKRRTPISLEKRLRGEKTKISKKKLYVYGLGTKAIFLGGAYVGYYLNSENFREKIDYLNEFVTPFSDVITEFSKYFQ
jgi:hypothetical protein